MRMLRIWEILRQFKDSCRLRGWMAPANEDWIEADGNYHLLLCTKDVHISSFKKLATNRRCVIRQGISYRVEEASYTAWLFSEPPSEDLVNIVSENPDFSSKIAIFDLSPLFECKNRYTRLNNTDSAVFKKFESYLANDLKAIPAPISKAFESETTLITPSL